MEPRKHYVFVCLNRRPETAPKGSCAGRGSEALYAKLKAYLAEKGLHRTEVRACHSSCLDACEHGPVLTVQPDGLFYGGVTLDDIPELVESIESGKPLERLLIATQDSLRPER